MTVHPINIPVARAVRDAILAHPDNFNMGHWFVDRGVSAYSQDVDAHLGQLNEDRLKSIIHGECQTTACIAGWAVLLTYGGPRVFPSGSRHTVSWVEEGTIRLGITQHLADQLFYGDGWPIMTTDHPSTFDDEGYRTALYPYGHTEATIAAMLLDIIIDGDDPWSLHQSDLDARMRKAAPVPVWSVDDIEFARGFNEAGE